MADNRKLSALPTAGALAAGDKMYVVQQGLSCQASLGKVVTFAAATMQPAAANLTALSGLEAVAGRLPYFTGTGAMATTQTTAFGRGLLNAADAGAGRGLMASASQSALDALAAGTTTALGLKADKAVAVTGAGLVTGGGALSASRTLTVTEASEAEALAGTAGDRAMTPRRTKAVVDAAVGALADDVDALAAAQTAGTVAAATWSELAAYPTGARVAGDYGRVVGADAGTHTDPVAGGTVNNRGLYAWSTTPAGWRRIADLDADDAAAQAAAAAASAASAVAAVAPTGQLPASVTHFYPCDEGAGTTLRDRIGTANADLTTGAGYSWAKGGWLQLTNGWFKLPSMAHRSMIVVLRAPDSMTTGYYFCNKDGLAVGPTYGNSPTNIPTFKMLSGWGIHTLTRRIDGGGSGPLELQAGGWIMPAPTFPSLVTGTPVIGAASTGGAGAVGSMEVAGIYIVDAAPSDTDLRRILDFERARQRSRGIYLTAADCPERRILTVAHGESTDEGTFYASLNASASGTTLTVNSVANGATLLAGHAFHNGLLAGIGVVSQLTGAPGGAGTYELSASVAATSGAYHFSGLPVSSQNLFSQTTFINARNSGSAATYNPMVRLSARPGYQNNVAPSKLAAAPSSGWEIGYALARNERPDDGRQNDLLKLGQGTSYMLPGGDNNTTTSTNYTNASGGTTAITASQSRNVGLIPGAALFSSLLSRNLHRADQAGRNLGIGYTTVIFVKNEGLNDAYIGAAAITSSAMYKTMLEAERDFLIADTGIAGPKQIVVKPHLPAGGLGGGDPEYPNTAVGTSRLAALNFIRTAIDDFGTANFGGVTVLEGDDYSLNVLGGDYAHPDADGYEAMGRDIETAARTHYSVVVEPVA